MKAHRVSLPVRVALLPSAFEAQTPKASPVSAALRAEMTRSLEHFSKLPDPPYFLSYEVIETESGSATGWFGTLVSSSKI